jgi:hypothetical protein
MLRSSNYNVSIILTYNNYSMDNITHTVKEKMKKVYSFTGTQLLITGIWIVILLSVVGGVGTGKWHMKMRNHMMRLNRQEMQQQYDRQWSDGKQKQGMIRWQSNDQIIDNQDQSLPQSPSNDTAN